MLTEHRTIGAVDVQSVEYTLVADSILEMATDMATYRRLLVRLEAESD